MIVLLLKVTVLLAIAFGSLPLLRNASAAIRHIVCASALAGTLLLPFSLFAPPSAGILTIGTDTIEVIARATVSPAAHWPLTNIFALVWAAGTAVLMTRIAIGYLTLRRLLRHAVPLEVTSPVPAFFADISVPVVCGIFQPVILLPRAAEHWTASQREAALTHELHHVERKDLWTMLTGHLVCAIYWFHPLAWAVARRMRDEQESACDDAVLASGFDPASYAEALVAAARNITSTRLIGCHMLTSSTLKSRIARLFDNGLPRISSRTALLAAAAVSLAVVAVVGTVAAAPQTQAPDETIYKVGNGITAPKLLSRIDPQYTPEAKADKVAGTVTLLVVIGTNGAARDIAVEQGLGSGLDEKAVEAVQQWLFQPGMKDGIPVSVRATIEINFKLQ